MRFLEPPFRRTGEHLLAMQISEKFLKVWIGGNSLQFFPGNSLQQQPGIMGKFPELGIELRPKLVRRVIERPPEIQSQASNSI